MQATTEQLAAFGAAIFQQTLESLDAGWVGVDTTSMLEEAQQHGLAKLDGDTWEFAEFPRAAPTPGKGEPQ